MTVADLKVSRGVSSSGMRGEGVAAQGLKAEAASSLRAGVKYGLPFADYLAGHEVSKSSLWTAVTRSPAHALVEKEESSAMRFGAAVHCAVLEPDQFRSRYVRGPNINKNTKEWRALKEEHGGALLDCDDFDAAITMRDRLNKDAVLRKLIASLSHVEASGFWTDQETGLACRCRPDALTRNGLLLDLKITTDARPHVFVRRVMDFGYHAQEALYTDGWRALDQDVAGFCFLVVEDKPPHAHAIYELEPAAVEEGRAKMRKALNLWADCAARGEFPAYPTGVQPLDLPAWAYKGEDV